MPHIGLKLRKIRLKRGFTLTDTARRAEIDTSTLCGIEKGRSDPSLAALRRLALILNCEIIIRTKAA